MPVTIGTQIPPQSYPPAEALFIERLLVITDPDGNENVIRTKEELDRVLDSMTPAQLEAWKINYRFTPVLNFTGNPNYSGTVTDTL